MKSFLVVLTVSTLMSVHGAQMDSPCTASGLMCKNCDDLAVCVSTVAGEWSQWTVSNCSGGCRDGACVPNAKCNYREFTCSEIGTFPDPYNCTQYHLCLGDVTPVTIDCVSTTGAQTAYNSSVNYCGFPTDKNDDCTNGPLPRCQTNLEVGVMPSNPNIYYICTDDGNSVGPNVYKCASGLKFNPATFICS